MSFMFPKEARRYFKSVNPQRGDARKFSTMFDQYYLCLLIGLDTRKLTQETAVETDRFVEMYPTDFHDKADLIAGLLVEAELARKEIGAHDREAIEKVMLQLIDAQSPTRLKADGHKLLNLYAAGGFGIIRDNITEPARLEDFLIAYCRLWNELHEPDSVL